MRGYKSSSSRLARLFKCSRNAWKEKALERYILVGVQCACKDERQKRDPGNAAEPARVHRQYQFE